MLNFLNPFSKKSAPVTLPTLLNLMKAASGPPSDENLVQFQEELINLSQRATEIIRRQNPGCSQVITLPSLSLKQDGISNDIDWFVVGDLHGDFQSLCRILLKIYCRPEIDPNKVRIVFLGDYVDRGARPLQVIKLLLLLKTTWPENFWLLKGNHEVWQIDDSGIVQSTVTPHDTLDFWTQFFGAELFTALCRLFDTLPVAYIQPLRPPERSKEEGSPKILYVHGGIPRTENLLLPLHAEECREGFLWSDPEMEKEEVLNGPSRRFSFGRNDFFRFSRHHNIALLIRGHELRKDGFDLHEDLRGSESRIVTIFSCGGTVNEDSFYGPEILVPRFLNLVPQSLQDLPISVEEVYRDDLFVAGSLRAQNPSLFGELVACLEHKLATTEGVNFNIAFPSQLNISSDRSNEYDLPNFRVNLSFSYGDSPDQIVYTIKMKFAAVSSSFDLIDLNPQVTVDRIVNDIRSIYPIFGVLPKSIL